jgi:hypothetical protein
VVVEGNNVLDERRCHVVEDDDAAEGPEIGLVNVVAAEDDDGQQNASTDNDIVATVPRSANAAATDAFLVMMMMCVSRVCVAVVIDDMIDLSFPPSQKV